MVKSYWLYLESFTFIWIQENKGLVYNSLSKESFEFNNFGVLKEIVDKLLDDSSMYSVLISENEKKDIELSKFINNIINTYSGQIIESNKKSNKPVIFPPRAKVFLKEVMKSGIKNIYENLFEINIYLNGNCSQNCDYCYEYYKQIKYCTKATYELEFKLIENLLEKIERNKSICVNFLGGNIFNYSKKSDLIELLLLKKYLIFGLYIHYLNIPMEFPKKLSFVERLTFKILVDFTSINELKNKIDFIIKSGIRAEWIFTISNQKELNQAQFLIGRYNLNNFVIMPVYKENSNYFEKCVFLTKDDILNSENDKRRLMMKKIVNANNFGVLTIIPNGKTYANLNHPPIGKLGEMSIEEIIMKELHDGKSWFNIRGNVEPCSKCLYYQLCPALSNYEIFSGRYNFCHINSR